MLFPYIFQCRDAVHKQVDHLVSCAFLVELRCDESRFQLPEVCGAEHFSLLSNVLPLAGSRTSLPSGIQRVCEDREESLVAISRLASGWVGHSTCWLLPSNISFPVLLGMKAGKGSPIDVLPSAGSERDLCEETEHAGQRSPPLEYLL